MTETVRESPQARLRREWGLEPRAAGRRLRVDDYFPFGCGDEVSRVDNPRDVGRVRAVVSNMVRVTWANGWVEDCDSHELEKASR